VSLSYPPVFGLLLYLQCRVSMLYTCDDSFYSFVVIQAGWPPGSYGEAEIDLGLFGVLALKFGFISPPV